MALKRHGFEAKGTLGATATRALLLCYQKISVCAGNPITPKMIAR